MFDFKSKSKTDSGYVWAPQTGKIVSVLEIPDEVFSEKILGDGVAIIPESTEILSPFSGEVVQVAETGHAFCLRSDEGLDLLIHIGVDTVGLRGKGFECFVKNNQKVQKGELIGKADIKFIKESGYSLYTAVLITNLYETSSMNPIYGFAQAGEGKIISYAMKK